MPTMIAPVPNSVAALLATAGDPDGTRTVNTIVGLLVLIGLVLLVVAVWLYRGTRPDPEALAPLDVMSGRGWSRSDDAARLAALDRVRGGSVSHAQSTSEEPDSEPEDRRGSTSIPGEPSVGKADDGTAGRADDGVGDSDDTAAAAVPDSDDEAGAVTVGRSTPTGTQRPDLEGLELHDIDPEILAAAQAELDAELGLGRDDQDDRTG